MKSTIAVLILSLILGSDGFSAAPAESSIIYTLSGKRYLDDFGWSAAPLGDIDGDGVPDFAVGSRQTFFNAEATGQVDVFSGKDGKVLWTWRGERQAVMFGESISVFQDLDGDGRKDIAIADEADIVHLYSTGTGELIRKINVRKDLGSVGITISNFSDVNRDGLQDLLVGQGGQGGNAVGRVAIYSSKDGSLIWDVMGQFKDGLLGDSFSEIGDVNGDGLSDVAVGESHGWLPEVPHHPGTVYILSGADGHELRQLGNDPALSYFGHRMANVGDLDGDGRPELAIGAPGYGVGDFHDVGWVGIYSTRTFELLRSFTGIDRQYGLFLGDLLGYAISSAGDADGDGRPDLLLGTYRFGTQRGRSEWARIELRSGKSGNLLTVYEGYQFGETFVQTLSPVGDIDGDGRSEFLIGSNTAPSPRGPGQVVLVRYRPELPAFIRGDGNQDGRVNIADAVFILKTHLFHEPPGPCFLALDVNGDAVSDSFDFIALIRFLFLNDFAPAPPSPECSRYGGFQEPRLDCQSSACTPG